MKKQLIVSLLLIVMAGVVFAAAPTTTISGCESYTSYNTEYQTLRLSCSANGSACAKTYYSVDGGAYGEFGLYGNPIVLRQDANHQIGYYSVAADASVETTKQSWCAIRAGQHMQTSGLFETVNSGFKFLGDSTWGLLAQANNTGILFGIALMFLILAAVAGLAYKGGKGAVSIIPMPKI
jgi:hypothetical protein